MVRTDTERAPEGCIMRDAARTQVLEVTIGAQAFEDCEQDLKSTKQHGLDGPSTLRGAI